MTLSPAGRRLTKAFAAPSATAPLGPFSFERREPGSQDVKIEILYCGVCHSDIHTVRNEWGGAIYPLVPGHEIVGRVVEVGSGVAKFKTGDLAGVGCFVDSCRGCRECQRGLQNYCERGATFTYNSPDKHSEKPTYGGYSTEIVVDENYILSISPDLPLEGVAPLLCAGITTYSPLRHWKVGAGHKVGVLGLGGLGHMAVKFAASFGAEVTMLSTSASKEADARRLGASDFLLTSDRRALKSAANRFDFIIDTVSAPHSYESFLGTLATDGVLICVGIPGEPIKFDAFTIVPKRRSIAGSMIGGIPETQEMLDYCAEHQITSDVEVIPMSQINEAYDRMMKNDVKYRFVINMASLREG